MKNLSQIQNTLSSHKDELFERFQIKNLAVFGSYARNEQKRAGAVDILVEFMSPVAIEFIDLADYLENVLKIRVDSVSRNGIKPKYFQQINGDST